MNPLKKSKRNFKRKIATTTGIPTTKSGRSRKVDALQGKLIGWLIIGGIILFVISGGSESAVLVH
ncbi:hypothetical protein [Reinekea blandensis]|uniref:hypothetical protein n=1 Tax=Reinekea blandensis TaxID=374838 RepID=UPI0012B5AC48|nr:hypothetical protein [Reinekea blandensis]